MDWLDLLAVQGTLKSFLQQYNSKVKKNNNNLKKIKKQTNKSISSLALSFPYSPTLMTTGKTIAFTRQTFVGKVMSLLFNTLSKFVIAFLPRSKRFLISWLQSPFAVTLEPLKVKSDTVSTVSPSISHEVMGQDTMILVF